MKDNFNIHLHFAESFAIQALSNLSSLDYCRHNAMQESVRDNVNWARENLAKALKAVEAFDNELASGSMVDTSYIDGEAA